MLQKTRGIVLRFTRFKETSIIVTVFTEVFGTHAYIVNGIRSKKASAKMALFQPLTLLDLVVYHKPNQQISRIKEVKCIYAFQSFSSDVNKSAIALFLNEVLVKCLKEESHPNAIFEFLQNSFITLDHLTKNIENFHLIFLVKLSRFLGFGISYSSLAQELDTELFKSLMDADYTSDLTLGYQQRRQLLESIIRFYGTNLDSFGQMRSLEIVRELLKP
jgi:DNA repair protein RecO (recombination protein O)